ncbi:MAG: J domain-containing protein, partial [Candidatus Limnocylindrales bacterium]
MKERTLYEVLMLHPTATTEVINAVYRTLAKRYHPDYAGPEGAQQMARINEAYAVLSHKEKRARYDEIIGVSKEGELVGHARQSMPGATNMKFEGGTWSVRSKTEPTPASAVFGEAGPPPRYPPAKGSVLSFGR